jgi:hypothetical protein
VPTYEYPGHYKFVEDAVAETTLSKHAPLSRHLSALRAMDIVAVQTLAADRHARAGVIQQIQFQRDALMTAARAADLLYRHLSEGLGLAPADPPLVPPSHHAAAAAPAKKARANSGRRASFS